MQTLTKDVRDREDSITQITQLNQQRNQDNTNNIADMQKQYNIEKTEMQGNIQGLEHKLSLATQKSD